MEAQREDPFLIKLDEKIRDGTAKEFHRNGEGEILRWKSLCVPEDDNIRREILEEAHRTPYTTHPGSTKMYQDLKGLFWWRNLKGEVASFVQKCMVCQQVKAEHQRPSGLLRPLDIPEWKCEHVTMGFVVNLPRSVKGNHVVWIIVDC